MAKTDKKSPRERENATFISKVIKAIVGLGVVTIIGLTSDLLGIASFCSPDKPKPESNSIDNRTINSTNNNVENNFITNNTYVCEINKEVGNISIAKQEQNPAMADILKAANYSCSKEFDLAYDLLNKYDSAPSGINPVAFYTLKGSVLFFRKEYDLSYKALLQAFKIDKNSKVNDLPKLRGLTYAYSHLKTNGYGLKDLKGIEMDKSRNMMVYDLGFKKIEMYNGFILLKDNEDNSELMQLIRDLKMERPMVK